jgi:hypothetical protein
VPKNPNPVPQQRQVGDKIKVNMHAGKLVDATINAIINSTKGANYQVDFGKDQTALVHEWQIVKDYSERLLVDHRTKDYAQANGRWC